MEPSDTEEDENENENEDTTEVTQNIHSSGTEHTPSNLHSKNQLVFQHRQKRWRGNQSIPQANKNH